MKNAKPVIVLGGGGHAAVLVDILLQQGVEILAYVCPEERVNRKVFSKLRQLKTDQEVELFSPEQTLLVNGVGHLANGSNTRVKLFDEFKALGYQFKSIIADSAIVSQFALLEEGVQVLHQVTIQAGAHIKTNSIVNTAATIEHDSVIGEHNHIAPKALVCGDSCTERNVFVGAAATIIQSISIGCNSIVGAGTTVTKSIAPNNIVYPAKVFFTHR